jgi:hypothetical protein
LKPMLPVRVTMALKPKKSASQAKIRNPFRSAVKEGA